MPDFISTSWKENDHEYRIVGEEKAVTGGTHYHLWVERREDGQWVYAGKARLIGNHIFGEYGCRV